MRLVSVRRLINKLAHYGIGLLSGFTWFYDWKLSVFLYGLFFAYEYVEEEKIHDEMYHELKEFTIGFVVGVLASKILSLQY